MKKALSLFLTAVMIALMIPISAFIVNGAENTVLTDSDRILESATEIYSLDFSSIASETELNAAGWHLIANSGSSPTAPTYGAASGTGLKYVLDSNGNFVFDGVKFNSEDSFVVDYTFKWNNSAWVAYNSFSFKDTTTYMAPTGTLNTTSYKFRANESNYAGKFDGATVYKDAACTTLANSNDGERFDAAGVTDAFSNFVDCRIQIFLEAGKTQSLIYTIGTQKYYVKLDSALSVSDNSLFGFAHAGGNGGGNRAILLKEFSVLKYSSQTPVYSVDFAKIDSDEELRDAGWYYPAKSGTEPKALEYTDEGLKYGLTQNASLIFGDMAFNTTDNYVIDYTFKWDRNAWIVHNHFMCRDTETHVNTATGTNSDKWLYRGNEENSKMSWDSATFYTDDTYTVTTTNGLSDDDVTAAFTDFVDVRIRILVEKGVSQYVTVNVNGSCYYIKKNTPLSVSDGSYFGFMSGASDSATRGMLLKRFSIWEYGTNAAEPYELACIKTDAVKRYVAGGSTVKVSDYTSLPLGVKTASGYLYSEDFTAAAGNEYEILTKDCVSDIKLTSGEATLRLASNAGIRYTTVFDSADISFINSLVNKNIIVDWKMGTVVTTKSHASKVSELTKEALSEYGASVGKKVYMDIVADAGALYAANTFAGSILGVKSYGVEYLGMGYITIMFSDGTTTTVYSDPNEATVAGLAEDIVNDTTAFSKYTAKEKTALTYLADHVPYGYAPLYDGSGEVEFIDSFAPSESHYIIVHNATQADFNEYTEKLSTRGFRCYAATTANGNLFETWTDGYAILTLSHIAYTDPATTDSAQKSPSVGEVEYISIAVDCVDNSALPTKEADIEKITRVQLTTIGTQCGYVIRLCDGRFIVFDGGLSENAANVYDIVVDQNVLDGKPVIAAWFITHFHTDHIGAANQFMLSYSNKVEVQSFVYNIPGDELYIDKNTAEGIPNDEDVNMRGRGYTFYERAEKYYPDATIIVAHAGQSFVYGDICVDVLWTTENHYGKDIIDTNQTSVMYSVTGNSGRMIILGDQQERGCAMLDAIYGSSLKCDLVQVSHHGYNGGDEAMYANMNADYAIWSASEEEIKADKRHSQNSRNLFDFKTVTYNIAPSESGSPVILYDGMTKAELAAYDIGLK
ncbi:MAG: MBL fold metallo-hydrolase [Clostridia bacterium]|nr:MBL fold metallo-hydrolase [Clostridia bacterium]